MGEKTFLQRCLPCKCILCSLYTYLTGIGGDVVQFDSKGDGIGKYDIFQYQHIRGGRYDYVQIGEWTDRYILVVRLYHIY